MTNIKDSFFKIKQEITDLRFELGELKSLEIGNRERIFDLCEIIEKLNLKIDKNKENLFLNSELINKTDNKENFSNKLNSSTDNIHISPLNDQNRPISIGNEGVQTDRQTDKQTNRQTGNTLDSAIEILDSLDNLKKEVRLKFKKLTDQEMLVFSAIYQIEGERGYSDYKSLSMRLNLSESSIRDYVRRLLNKKIPLEKKKINNKEIQIIISPNLKKIASLNTILELREI